MHNTQGGEFAVLQEANKSGVLCAYAQKGVIVTLLLEQHEPQFQAANLDMAIWHSIIKDLRECGVTIEDGGMSMA